MFPPPWAMARLGEAFADQRSAGTIAGWEQYAKNLEYWLAQYQEEYAHLLSYTDELKRLYASVTDHAFREHGQEYPIAPAGIITSLGARLTALNFFESGADLVSKENRVYSNVFSRANTRFVCWEINLKHIPPANRIDFQITSFWQAPKCPYSDRPSIQLESYILPEWGYSHHAHGYGSNERGTFSEGIHIVELWIGDEFIVVGQFEIR